MWTVNARLTNALDYYGVRRETAERFTNFDKCAPQLAMHGIMLPVQCKAFRGIVNPENVGVCCNDHKNCIHKIKE